MKVNGNGCAKQFMSAATASTHNTVSMVQLRIPTLRLLLKEDSSLRLGFGRGTWVFWCDFSRPSYHLQQSGQV